MLKYLLTRREKGGWWSSIMDGPGAQAALHRTTAVQRKSMESEGNVHPQSEPTHVQWLHLFKPQSYAETQRLPAVWQLPPTLQRRNLAQPAQLSSATRAEHICCACTPRSGSLTHPDQDMWHEYLLSQKQCLLRGRSTRTLCHPCNGPTADEWQTKLSHWYWETINPGQSPILIALPLLVCTKWVLLSAMKYWPVKNGIHFHKKLMMGFQVMMAVPATSFVSHPLGHCTAQSILCTAPIK